MEIENKKPAAEFTDHGEEVVRGGIDNLNILKQIPIPLTMWYKHNARPLPWRENKDPYRIWISEIMLQQTRIEAVKPYFDRFIGKLSDIAALAAAEDDFLMKLWEGLGYYSRARNLKKAAQIIIEEYQGKMPHKYDELKKLPGIGPYTAGAIASIAFDEKAPAVDGNVLRVLSRITASYEDILKPALKKRAEAAVCKIIPDEAGAFNEALMELGETICTPGSEPDCRLCPLKEICLAKRLNIANEIPIRIKKTKRRIEEWTNLLIVWQDMIMIRKRSDTGLLAGLYEFPQITSHIDESTVRNYLREYHLLKADMEARITKLPPKKHIFSHIEWHMIGYFVELMQEPEDLTFFMEIKDMDEKFSLPSPFQIYRRLI